MTQIARLVRLKLRIIIALLLGFFVLYVGLGRLLLSFLPSYHADLEQALSSALGQQVKVGRFEGSWHRFDPEVILYGIELMDSSGDTSASISSVEVRLAFLESVKSRDIRFKSIFIDQAYIPAIQKDETVWEIASYRIDALDGGTSGNNRFSRWIDGADIWFENTQIRVDTLKYPPRLWWLPVVSLTYDDNQVYGSGHLMNEGSTQPVANFSLHAEQLFSPEDPIGQFYLEARSLSFLDNILETFQYKDLAIETVDASGRFWFDFDDEGQYLAQGDVQVRSLSWSKSGEIQPPLTRLATHFSWQSNPSERRFSFHDLAWDWQGQSCEPFSGEWKRSKDADHVYVDLLDIACLNQMALDLALVEGRLQNRLQKSQPRGHLQNLSLTVPNDTVTDVDADTANGSAVQGLKAGESMDQGFLLEAELVNVQLDDFFGTPSGSGIEGFLRADAQGGTVWLNSQAFRLGFPDLFLDEFVVTNAQAEVSWRLLDDETWVGSDGISLLLDDGSHIYGDFSLRLNDDEHEDYLGLALAMQDVPFTEVHKFVPYHRVDQDLHHWLRKSLSDGLVSSGVYYGYGSIEDDSADNSFTSSLRVTTSQGQVKFQPDWPSAGQLDATVELQDDVLWMAAPKGTIANTSISNLWVHLPPRSSLSPTTSAAEDAPQARSLQISLESELSQSNVEYWLSDSPISNETEDLATAISVEGGLSLDLALDVPLDDRDIDYSLVFGMKDNSLTHEETGFVFSSIHGGFVLDSQTGLDSNGLSTRFLGFDSEVQIKGDPSEEVAVAMTGRMTPDALYRHFDLAPFTGIQGSFEHSSVLTIPANSEPVNLMVESTLNGLERDWPSPLGKAQADKEKLRLSMDFKRSETVLDLSLKQDQEIGTHSAGGHPGFETTAKLSIPEQGAPEGQILVSPLVAGDPLSGQTADSGSVEAGQGPTDLTNQVPAVVDTENTSGLFVVGKGLVLNLEEWIEFVATVSDYFPESEGDTRVLRSVDLELDAIDVFGRAFSSTRALIENQDDGWSVSAKGESIQGTILLETESRPLTLDLEHLSIKTQEEPPLAGTNAASGANADDQKGGSGSVATSVKETGGDQSELGQVSAVFDPRSIPELDFSIKNLLLDHVNYGAWRSSVQRTETGARFSNLKGQVSGLSFSGLLNWELVEGHPNTFLELSVNGEDVEPFFKRIGKSPPLSSETFSADFSLVWPDEPQNFELGKISGTSQIVMSEGFLNTPNNKTGALRLMGILNAEALGRRLRLDFSDIYKSGIGYDSLELFARINQGHLRLDPALTIAGPNSKYIIKGHSDLGDQTLDLKMKVELPVGSNVPIAAVILGAPQIGGAVWLVDKLLGEPLSSIASVEYDVKGTWDEPKLVPR